MQVKRTVAQLGHKIVRANIVDAAAMMAFYAILSLFPMLVFVLTVAMLVLPHGTVEQGFAMATETMPSDVAALLVGRVRAAMEVAGTGVAISGLAIALWSAAGGLVSLMTALNLMSETPETRSWVRRRLTALGITLAVAVLIVIALALLVIGPIAGHWLIARLGLGPEIDLGLAIARWVGAGLLVMTVWAILYTFLPAARTRFRLFTPGAVIGVAGWIGISYAFGIYLSHFNKYEATYGALGSAIIFLTWLWLSNLALLFGAVVNAVLADTRAPTRDVGNRSGAAHVHAVGA